MATVTPANIAAAALISQFSIVSVIVFAAFILNDRRRPSFTWEPPPFFTFAWMVLFFSIGTIGCIIFCNEFANFWRPVFNDVAFQGIPWSTALLIVFVLDIVWVGILVVATGGSYASPFTPLFFLIPTVAIFLRESMGRVAIYTLMVAIFFSATVDRDDPAMPRCRVAYWIVSVACFFLATFVGYVTRPAQ